jgi:CheY-like chemotaxis protein
MGDDHASLRILLIDDSATARVGLTEVLRCLGYQAVAVENGRAALARLEGEPFDAILCDLVMPDMDGIEVLKAVRAKGFDLPFMLMTAYGSISSAITALRLGAEDYLLKPIDEELLRRRIGTLQERRQLANELADKRRMEGALAMAGAAAHELNQPLTAILGSAELVTMTSDPARIKSLAERILTEADRMGQIIQRLVKTVRWQTRPYVGSEEIVALEEEKG